MKRAFFIVITFCIYISAISQSADFIVLKKNQKTIKSFFAGSNIGFQTDRGYYSGQLNVIKKDSLFLSMFDVRQVATNLGVYTIDTVAIYRIAFNYKEIVAIENQKSKGFNLAATGGSLFGGGILITAVGLGTWIFTKPRTQYHASPALVIAGASLGALGYLLLKSNGSVYKIGKKYQLEYIKVK